MRSFECRLWYLGFFFSGETSEKQKSFFHCYLKETTEPVKRLFSFMNVYCLWGIRCQDGRLFHNPTQLTWFLSSVVPRTRKHSEKSLRWKSFQVMHESKINDWILQNKEDKHTLNMSKLLSWFCQTTSKYWDFNKDEWEWAKRHCTNERL